MKKIFLVCVFGLSESVILFGLGAVPVRADTHVGGTIMNDTEWSSANSPYLLDSDVTISDGATLTIDPGVSVTIAPEADSGDIGYDPALYVSGGHLVVNGQGDKRVSIRSVGGPFIAAGSMGAGTADIKDADLTGGSSFSFQNAIGSIASTTVTDANIGLWSKDSNLKVWGSRFTDDDTGVYIQPHKVVLLGSDMNAKHDELINRFATGGIGNALAQADTTASSSLTISDSSLGNDGGYSLKNMADFTVMARNDWWGSPAGPNLSGSGAIQGSIAYDPWLTSEPALDGGTKPVQCCSSVLFIPGLEGTRLYRNETLPLGLGTTNELWEPNRNADVIKLDSNANGSSTDPSIYSGLPIDKALGFVDIYSKFMSFMDGLVKQGTMNEWRPYGYDWREPIPQVVNGNEKKATTTETLIKVAETLAANSRTGKITIIAHSNGGLVAKYLVKTLSDLGKADIIDTVISVAVPSLGTPVAIPALLHGDGQALLGGLIVNQANARGMGMNMPSAYSLLPSAAFFQNVFTPTIVFASTTISGINAKSYPLAIDSYQAQTDFMTDAAHARSTPDASDTKSAIKANQKLITASHVMHSILDSFMWPTSIAHWTIAGFGVPTVETLVYGLSGHTAVNSIYGDGTVLAPSASYDPGNLLVEDLRGTGTSHVNIMESSSTESAIGDIITDPHGSNSLPSIRGISAGGRDWNSLMIAENVTATSFRVSTHSPIKLNVYDPQGRHTGEATLPAGVASQVDPGLYTMKEENIPYSSYEVDGCNDEDADDCDSEIDLPDNGNTYTVSVDGVGTGTFTLDIEKIRGASTTDIVEWKDIPVTNNTMATTTFATNMGTVKLASSTGALQIDVNGNGTSDITIQPGGTITKGKSSDWDGLNSCLKGLGSKGITSAAKSKILDDANNFFKRFK